MCCFIISPKLHSESSERVQGEEIYSKSLLELSCMVVIFDDISWIHKLSTEKIWKKFCQNRPPGVVNIIFKFTWFILTWLAELEHNGLGTKQAKCEHCISPIPEHESKYDLMLDKIPTSTDEETTHPWPTGGVGGVYFESFVPVCVLVD